MKTLQLLYLPSLLEQEGGHDAHALRVRLAPAGGAIYGFGTDSVPLASRRASRDMSVCRPLDVLISH